MVVSDNLGVWGPSVATIFKLIIEDDEGKTTVFPLGEGEVSLGRKESNTIRLMERNVSRRHARLSRHNGSVFIEDLDSYNGIRINGERIAGRYPVNEGDLVEIGDYHLALQKVETSDEDRRSAAPESENRDTVIDEPVPVGLGASGQARTALDSPVMPQPLVKPPPRGDGRTDLPPFPMPGGLPPPRTPLLPEPTPATQAVETQPQEDEPLAVGPAVVSTIPRLICVSTSYAGQEFSLARPEIIIGRVEDNDIVIEHRSVSRNHAKILFDGRSHKIIDLKSANGILVNGEEYEVTDLVGGDVIELGHVRFRFVLAHEPFVPTTEEVGEMREAGVEPPPPPRADHRPPGRASSEAPMPAFDPSTAATVTDTARDALGEDVAARPIVAPRPSGAASKKNGHGRAADELRPTEQLEVGPPRGRGEAATMRSAAVAPTIPDFDPPSVARPVEGSDGDLAVPGKPNVRLAIVGGLVLVALGLGAMLFALWGVPGRDAQIEAAYQAGDWEKVIHLYEEDPAGFANPRDILPMYREAIEKAQGSAGTPRSDVEPPPAGAIADGAEPAPAGDDPEPIPAGAALAPPGLDPRDDAVPEASPTGPKANARSKRKRTGASRLAKEGQKALLQGELARAEPLLLQCIRVDDTDAACHRLLGVLYARKNDTQRSLQHYRRYLELNPNARDGDRVRTMIERAVEAGAERPL